MLGLAVIAAVALVACGGDSQAELAGLNTELEALRDEVGSLREEVAGVSQRTPMPTAQSSPSAEDFRRLETELEQLAEATNDRFAPLEADTSLRMAPAPSVPLPVGPFFTLQLLHAADTDSAVGALENVENFSAMLDGFRAQFPDNTLAGLCAFLEK